MCPVPPSLQTLSQRTGDEFLCQAGVAGELLVRDKEQSPVKKGDKGSSGCPQHWIGGHLLPQGRAHRGGRAGTPGPLAWILHPLGEDQDKGGNSTGPGSNSLKSGNSEGPGMAPPSGGVPVTELKGNQPPSCTHGETEAR